ncbi:MAG: SDR family NAD(P)-dependent oxidoreductase [Pseudomonadota bacterium]
MSHPAFNADSVAVITGGASGIGLAAAVSFARINMRVVIVDQAADKLTSAAKTLRKAGAAVRSDLGI